MTFQVKYFLQRLHFCLNNNLQNDPNPIESYTIWKWDAVTDVSQTVKFISFFIDFSRFCSWTPFLEVLWIYIADHRCLWINIADHRLLEAIDCWTVCCECLLWTDHRRRTNKYCGSLEMDFSVFSLCFSYFAHFRNFSDIFGLEYLSVALVDRSRHLLVSFNFYEFILAISRSIHDILCVFIK